VAALNWSGMTIFGTVSIWDTSFLRKSYGGQIMEITILSIT